MASRPNQIGAFGHFEGFGVGARVATNMLVKPLLNYTSILFDLQY